MLAAISWLSLVLITGAALLMWMVPPDRWHAYYVTELTLVSAIGLWVGPAASLARRINRRSRVARP